MTALHLAARRGSVECVEVLLGAGADREAVIALGRETGKTPAELASERSDEQGDRIGQLLRELDAASNDLP